MKKNKEKKKKGSIWKFLLGIILIGGIGIVSIILAFALYIVIISPDFEKEELYQIEPTIFLDIHGNTIAKYGEANNTLITYDEIPDVVVDALIATEDSRFFQHKGIDLFRFIKASFLQALGKNDAGGASTLDMQLIKQTYTGRVSHGFAGIVRKFEDVYMSVFKLEANYTKDEIIEFYLNSQDFAYGAGITLKSNSIRGIEQASQYFFGKSCKDLNLAEATILVGMFKAPDSYNPYKNPAKSRERQETVLKLMVRHGYITNEEKDAVLQIPIENLLVGQDDSDDNSNISQNLVQYTADEIMKKLKINVKNGGYIVQTTYDLNVQQVLSNLENGELFKFPNDRIQEGVAVTSSKDGSIVALSAGRGYKAGGTDRATKAKQQPGSTAKPLVEYAMYLQHISQSTYDMILDEKMTYSDGGSIRNYDGSFQGLITLRHALVDSRNIPALRVFQKVNSKDKKLMPNFLKSIGIDVDKEGVYEADAIGSHIMVTPLQLSAAYAVFARGGYYIEPYSYTKVTEVATGKEYTNSYTKQKVLDESTAFMINDLLKDVYKGKAVSGTDIAAKTGTTNLDSSVKEQKKLPSSANREVWMVSYSPSHSIALWYGYDQIYDDAAEKKYYLSSGEGSSARRQIMSSLASSIHEKNNRFTVPKTITSASVELESFPPQLCSSHTPKDKCVTEYFVKGAEPTEVSKRYSDLDNPTNGSYTFAGNTITIKWNPIATPSPIDTSFLTNHFREYYGSFADKYYQKRMEYNASFIGSLGYEIYLKNSDGSETRLGYTNSPLFSYTVPAGGNYTFIVRSAYSIFKDNMSSGLTISTKTIDSGIGDVTPSTPENPDTDTENDEGLN